MTDLKHTFPETLAVDAKALAGMLCVSVRTVRTWDASGRLPLRFGRSIRWSVDDLRAWIAHGSPDRKTWEAIRDNGVILKTHRRSSSG